MLAKPPSDHARSLGRRCSVTPPSGAASDLSVARNSSRTLGNENHTVCRERGTSTTRDHSALGTPMTMDTTNHSYVAQALQHLDESQYCTLWPIDVDGCTEPERQRLDEPRLRHSIPELWWTLGRALAVRRADNGHTVAELQAPVRER